MPKPLTQAMPHASKTRTRGHLPLLGLLLLSVILSLTASWAFYRHGAGDSLLDLANLVGPTTASLLGHRGLTACVVSMGTLDNPICFHAGRMPIPSLTVALGIVLFGDHVLRVAIFKLLLFLIPVELAIRLTWRQLSLRSSRSTLVFLLLLTPFVMTPFLADVVNLQVEEGYTYSVLALAVAILFFTPGRSVPALRTRSRGILMAIAFGLSIDALYLAKSSMIPAVAVLTVAFLWREQRLLSRVLVAALIAVAPIGWAFHQHHASGRYSIGTSIDGMNLHKGNSEYFTAHYPPPPGESLDSYDPALNAGHYFPDEWSFNDFHQRAALAYVRAHPAQTLSNLKSKLYVIFVTTQKFGSGESHGFMLKLETFSILLFRLYLWSAIALSVYGLLWRKSWRSASALYLALLAACVLPYLLGFAYIRHVSILVYPSVLLLCAVAIKSQAAISPRPD